MAGVSTALGCSSGTDIECLCSEANAQDFAYGMRDCGEQACGESYEEAAENLCGGAGAGGMFTLISTC